MARIGVAVIGAGFHGRGARRGAAARGVRVVGVLGVSDAESTKFAEAIGAPKAYRSLKELLDDKAVESVHIGHPEQAALRDGEGGDRAAASTCCARSPWP